jgi:acetyl esterase/lipase
MEPVIHDPELEPLLALAPAFALSSEALPLMREQRLNAAVPELSDAVERTNHVVRAPSVDGSVPALVVRVHRPVGVTGPLPCIYSMHGGGYVVGSCEMEDPRFDRLCADLRCVAVSVEYRLAPETPYPGPLEDCYAGLAWTVAHAAELGIDARHIGISGISAGGGLAAGLALLVRDRGEYTLAFQLLECPMIDDRQVTSSSARDGLVVWSKESNSFGWRSYLGDLYGRDDISHYAAPARALDLHGLPPAFVIVGGADGFRDEDIDYALRLNQAGVPAELHVLPGAPHGVQLFAQTDIARRWSELVERWLQRVLSVSPATG